MHLFRITVALLVILGCGAVCSAGDIYTITSSDGKTSYKVMFGSGRAAGRLGHFTGNIGGSDIRSGAGSVIDQEAGRHHGEAGEGL